MDDSEIFDVAIVEYGPVGAALAILLGQQGHRVVVLERYTEPYPLPAPCTTTTRWPASCSPAAWRSGAPRSSSRPRSMSSRTPRKALVRFGRRGGGPSGWPQSSMFSQPELEAVLFARVDEIPRIEVRRGWAVSDLADDGDHVVVRSAAGSVRARYVVGCDGANSTVRSLTGITMEDQAFFYDWLVVDVVFHEPRVFDPLNVQICDPARPTTVVSGGPGRRRWEFMALPGESVEFLNEEATAWRLLERFDARPENARLEKHAVYRFQARWVEEWRRGRVLLAGDAAHQTPPFAGQGLCSGLRDAANLAWKLDLVLRDLAPDALLDAYGLERGRTCAPSSSWRSTWASSSAWPTPTRPQPGTRRSSPPTTGPHRHPPFPPIAQGVILAGSPCAGELFIQAEVEADGRPGPVRRRRRCRLAPRHPGRARARPRPRRVVRDHRWRRGGARLR